MTDVRDYRRDRAVIADAVIRRVGGDRQAVAGLVEEIQGDFSSHLHRAAIDFLPPVLAVAFGGGAFVQRVVVEGCVDPLRELATRATLVLAPTHASNLDSIVLGVVAGRLGLPPFAYAAGKHIFRHRLFAYLMHRLGAYRLDPDRRERLYLRVVQVYVNELVARGYHTVVFPSGTRCRSGEVESALKLGLLGAAVHVARPIAIVPVTINYQVVLEADSLIAYHLAGRSRERIVGDELFVWGRLVDTTRRLAKLDQRIVIRFGTPIDPHAGTGSWRPRIAGALTTSYRRDTVFFSTHIVARAIHDLGVRRVSVARVTTAIEVTRTRLARDPALGAPWDGLAAAAPIDLLAMALTAWRSWHPMPPVTRQAEHVEVTSPELLLFYRNRTAHIAP